MVRWMICSLLPLLFVACSPNNVTVDDSLKKYFDNNKVEGTFGLYDNGQGKFTVYNLSRFSDSAYVPASTFKIINSLIGLETGQVADSNTIFVLDSNRLGRTECNKDMNMREAFRLSCPNWYQQLAVKIGKPAMQKWLDTLGYAQRYNKFAIGDNLDTFWLDNSAKITADEELGIVKRLYFDQLPFQQRSQRIVKDMMKWESNSNYSLFYKTGWGFKENGNPIGWIVGWIEENTHPYFFVLQLESTEHQYDMKPARINILKDILKQYGFMEGKK